MHKKFYISLFVSLSLVLCLAQSFNQLVIKGIVNLTQFYNTIGLDDWTEG